MNTTSIDEIAQNISRGCVLKHKTGDILKVISVDRNANSDYYLTVLVNDFEKKIFSLKTLLEKSLILNEELFFSTQKVEEELKHPVNGVGNYSELFSLMEKGDSSIFRYCRYFWHITNAINLAEIVKSGVLRARSNIEGNIPYDNRIKNETSKEVMATNFSELTEQHVRFYLRPLNKPFFRMLNNEIGQVKDDLTMVAIGREALFKSPNSTFLYPGNAHRAVDADYDPKYRLNMKFKNSFVVNHLDKFDFNVIYSMYEVEQSDETKRLQQAEFLVWKELSIAFIQRIFFQSEMALNRFLSAIRPLPVYNEIKDKCEVNHDIFHEYK